MTNLRAAQIDLGLAFFDATERPDVAVLLCCGYNSHCTISEIVFEQVDRGQGGADHTVMKRVAEGKSLVLGLWASD